MVFHLDYTGGVDPGIGIGQNVDFQVLAVRVSRAQRPIIALAPTLPIERPCA